MNDAPDRSNFERPDSASTASTECAGRPSLPSEQAQLPPFPLKELSERHKLVCSLLAQGVQRQVIAAAADYTPEYITMLAAHPLCKAYIAKMNEGVSTQLDAMFSQSVDVIADAMNSGNHTEKLKAARLQLEATRRIGPDSGERRTPENEDERLDQLSERLVNLLRRRKVEVYDGEAKVISDAEVLEEQPGEAKAA